MDLGGQLVSTRPGRCIRSSESQSWFGLDSNISVSLSRLAWHRVFTSAWLVPMAAAAASPESPQHMCLLARKVGQSSVELLTAFTAQWRTIVSLTVNNTFIHKKFKFNLKYFSSAFQRICGGGNNKKKNNARKASPCDITKGCDTCLTMVTAPLASCWLRPLGPPLFLSPIKRVEGGTTTLWF